MGFKAGTKEAMTAAVLNRLVTHDTVPEMKPPQRTILMKPAPGYTRDLEIREDAPYFNASTYCNKIGLRFSTWLRHPATIALIQSYNNYYREAAHENCPILVMQVKTGARVVHGYYLHMMLHDALSVWCDFELIPVEDRPRMPPSQPRAATVVYTTHTVIDANASREVVEAAQAGARERIASVISAARGGRI